MEDEDMSGRYITDEDFDPYDDITDDDLIVLHGIWDEAWMRDQRG